MSYYYQLLEGDEGKEDRNAGWSTWTMLSATLSKNNVFKIEREESFKVANWQQKIKYCRGWERW
jgi:hypothetical protein